MEGSIDGFVLPELVYRPFKSEYREIRLLELQPAAEPESPLRCKIRHCPLSSAEYCALSYVWGDQVNDRSDVELTYKDDKHGGKKLASKLNGTFAHFFHADKPRMSKSNLYRKSIGSSLAKALRHLRQPQRPLVIWVDALSINQDDPREKSWQVRLMTRIFAKATMVHSWLGPRHDEDPNITKAVVAAFYFITRIGEAIELFGCKNRLSTDTSWLSACFALAQPRKPETHPKAAENYQFWAAFSTKLREMFISEGSWDRCLSALNTLSRSDYFSRIWILQESGKAQALTFHYAGHEASNKLVFLSLCFAQGIYTSSNSIVLRTLSTGFDSRFLSCLTARIPCDLSAVLQMAYFSRSRMHEATDPRDLIFGLFGLTSGRVDIKVDYSLSVEEVYIETAELLLNEGFTQLLTAFKPYTSNQYLPSWAYDWSAKGLSSFERFMACGNTTQDLSFIKFSGSEYHTAMTLKGSRIGYVAAVGPGFYTLANEAGFTPNAIQTGIGRDGHQPLSAQERQMLREEITSQYRKLHTNVSGADIEKLLHDPSIPLALFWLWWIKWVSMVGTFALTTVRQRPDGEITKDVFELLLRSEDTTRPDGSPILKRLATAKNIRELIDLRLWFEPTSSKDKALGADVEQGMTAAERASFLAFRALESLFRSVWGLRPIALDTGHIGYAPETARSGDEVVIFHGVKAPLLVRKAGEDSYRIVGPAHICRAMQGQLMNRNPPEDTYVLI